MSDIWFQLFLSLILGFPNLPGEWNHGHNPSQDCAPQSSFPIHPWIACTQSQKVHQNLFPLTFLVQPIPCNLILSGVSQVVSVKICVWWESLWERMVYSCWWASIKASLMLWSIKNGSEEPVVARNVYCCPSFPKRADTFFLFSHSTRLWYGRHRLIAWILQNPRINVSCINKIHFENVFYCYDEILLYVFIFCPQLNCEWLLT